jgi:hypothetical protein
MLRRVYAAVVFIGATVYFTAPASAHDASGACQVDSCAANPNRPSVWSLQPRGASPYFTGILNDKNIKERFVVASGEGKGKGKGG